jgi:hypothetical protein
MYNRTNWRDVNKDKGTSRNEAIEEDDASMFDENAAYTDYQVQKSISKISKKYRESEVRDQWSNGDATQVHHIFPKSDFPKLSHSLENLIKLTATQHYTKAHPANNTQQVNKDYQLTCLLAKADSIETSLNRGEYIYRKESFIYVINNGLNIKLDYELGFRAIREELMAFYNNP